MCRLQLFGDRHLGTRDVVLGVVQLVVVADHVLQREQAALFGDQLDEFGGDARDADLVQDRVDRVDLVLGGERRVTQEPAEVVALVDQLFDRREILGDLLG